jgi:hypothetical protein
VFPSPINLSNNVVGGIVEVDPVPTVTITGAAVDVANGDVVTGDEDKAVDVPAPAVRSVGAAVDGGSGGTQVMPA